MQNLIEKTPELIVIGGGNGTSALLRGFLDCGYNTAAIVNVVDDGGSTGRLREAYPGLIGIGDIRQCMSAAAENRKLAYEFNVRENCGHAKGNIWLAESAIRSGGPQEIEAAIDEWSAKLDLKGEVIPVSLDSSELSLLYPDSERAAVVGESAIAHTTGLAIREKLGRLTLSPAAELNSRAERAVYDTRAVVIAPGNFYGSVLPPFLTKGLKEAIVDADKPVIMVSNLTNCMQTRGFTTADYEDELRRLTGILPDVVIAHNADTNRQKTVTVAPTRYAELMIDDLLSEEEASYDPNDTIAARRSRLRHNGHKLGEIVGKRLLALNAG